MVTIFADFFVVIILIVSCNCFAAAITIAKMSLDQVVKILDIIEQETVA
jgi:hypothetical protein